MDPLLSYLKCHEPDILLLQETKVQDHEFPQEIFRALGYHIAFWGEKKLNGVAIFSKFPMDSIQRSFPQNNLPDESRFLEVITAGLKIICVYVPNGQSVDHPRYHDKLLFLEGLNDYLCKQWKQEIPLIIGGDFNVAPLDNDVADPESWKERILCSALERLWIKKMWLQGYMDPLANGYLEKSHEPLNQNNSALVKKPGTDHPNRIKKNPYTWWNYQGWAFQKNQGLRIDYFLLSPEAADLLEEAGVSPEIRGQEKASDHAPVWCILNPEKSKRIFQTISPTIFETI
jgi:exodeoxyribonuclease III